MDTKNMSSECADTSDKILEMFEALERERYQTLLMSKEMNNKLRNEFSAASSYPTDNVLMRDSLLTRGTHYMGFPIVVADVPKREVLDWSDCRSPARAKRRHAKGKPQRVKVRLEECVYLISGKPFI